MIFKLRPEFYIKKNFYLRLPVIRKPFQALGFWHLSNFKIIYLKFVLKGQFLPVPA